MTNPAIIVQEAWAATRRDFLTTTALKQPANFNNLFQKMIISAMQKGTPQELMHIMPDANAPVQKEGEAPALELKYIPPGPYVEPAALF